MDPLIFSGEGASFYVPFQRRSRPSAGRAYRRAEQRLAHAGRRRRPRTSSTTTASPTAARRATCSSPARAVTGCRSGKHARQPRLRRRPRCRATTAATTSRRPRGRRATRARSGRRPASAASSSRRTRTRPARTDYAIRSAPRHAPQRERRRVDADRRRPVGTPGLAAAVPERDLGGRERSEPRDHHATPATTPTPSPRERRPATSSTSSYNPRDRHSATWTNISYDLGDQPITNVAARLGDAATSTSAPTSASAELAHGTTQLRLPASARPADGGGLTGSRSPGGKKAGDRVLYAATHGRGVWRLQLPDVEGPKH